MKMIRWREANKIPLAKLRRMLDLPKTSDGHLSRIERGQVWPGAEIAYLIEAVTGTIGPEAVTIEDHLEAWLECHPQEAKGAKRIARAAWTQHRSEAKETRKNGNRKEEGRRQEGGVQEGERRPRRRRKEGP